MSQQEMENTRVKQGVGNAPAPDRRLDPLPAPVDENPATRALREQHDREALQHLVQNDALVTAAEQGRQQEYLREQGLVDEPDKD